MKKIHKILAIVAVLMLVCLVWIIWGNVTVALNRVTIVQTDLPEGFDGFRIAHVSDLHNSRLWKKALTRLTEAAPDMICITGDLVDSRSTDIQVALNFAAEAVKIAPCYYVPGNHEGRLDPDVYGLLVDGLTALGVTVLQGTYTELTRQGDTIMLGGLGFQDPQKNLALGYVPDYRILLAHHPEYFAEYVREAFDLVLSGHIHGGQFRLPFIGGLYAPNQGLFPEYDSGLYESGDTTMYISRGVGNSVFPIRINNRPEVVVITLVKAQGKG